MADNKIYQKNANVSLVMQTIRVKKEISRIEISRELGLDRSTITNIVTKLIENNLLVEKSEGVSESKGGRKPVLLGINPEFGVILGLELQVNIYRATLLTVDGFILWKKYGKLDKELNLKKSLQYIYNQIISEIESNKTPLIGIGVGLPGHIDPIKGQILSSSPYYSNEDLELESLFNVPVFIDNDANCCALGVLEIRKDRGLKNFLYSIIESHGSEGNIKRELGFGIVINGAIYYGDNFSAGELVNPLISGINDEEYFKGLFENLKMFISFLNPSHLFLGGEFIQYKEIINKLITGDSIKDRCEIVFSDLQEFEVAYGAASMFIERLFKIPEVDGNNSVEFGWEKIMDLRNEKGAKNE